MKYALVLVVLVASLSAATWAPDNAQAHPRDKALVPTTFYDSNGVAHEIGPDDEITYLDDDELDHSNSKRAAFDASGLTMRTTHAKRVCYGCRKCHVGKCCFP